MSLRGAESPATIDLEDRSGARLPVGLAALKAAARSVLTAEGRTGGSLSITFLDDVGIARLNGQYLDRPHATDVLAFALHPPGAPPVGDVYIGAEQAERQAADLHIAPGEELLRLVVHGTLHVLGYDHPDGEERYESEMFQRQEELLRPLIAALPAV